MSMKQKIDRHQYAKLKEAKIWIVGEDVTYMIPKTLGELIQWMGEWQIREHELDLLAALESEEPLDALVELVLKIKESE